MKSINVVKGLTPSEVKLLAVLGAAAFVLASTYSSINVALPKIQNDFAVSLSALKWVSIIGSIMVASLSLCFGRIGDLMGRRRIYKIGIIIYTLGAGLTATSMSFPELMGFRVFMAIGLAMSNPLAGAIIAATVTPERRGQAVGLYASAQAAGQLTGPTFGGFILQVFSWRGIFLSYFALGVVLSIAQFFLLRGHEERRHEPFDLLGALLLLIGYPSLLIALSLGPGSGWDAPLTLLWFAIGGVGLASFALRELHYEQPIFHFRFFKSGAFCVAMFMLVVASAVQNPITLFAPLYLQKVLNHNSLTVGFIMMALPISTLIAGPIGGSLSDRRNPRVVAGAGAAVTFVAVFLYSRAGVDGPLLLVVAALVLVGIGAGLFRPANQVWVYGDTQPRDYGAVTAMLVLVQSLAGTMGTTIAVAMNETRSAGSDPASFTSGQRFTFAALLPLLALSTLLAFAGRSKRPKPEVVETEVVG